MRPCALPERALLLKYRGEGAYTDCYVAEVAAAVEQAAFVEAFYTTALFKLERLLLSLFLKRPTTDAEVRELALGRRAAFAAWEVEAREPGQVLLTDFRRYTRSWLMSAAEGGGTRLYFGSAVVPRVDRRTGERRMGFAFRALLGFHKLYSRALLAAAVRRLR